MKWKFSKPILMYHRVDHQDQETKLSVSPKSFRNHLEYFKKSKKNAVVLDVIVNGTLDKGRDIAITFDDGFLSCFEEAYPLLLEFEQKATFYVVTDFIGKEEYMDKEQIRELDRQGFEIGSHARSHQWLPQMKQEEVREEVTFSKNYLEDLLGKSVTSFSYPFGALNQMVIDETKAAGYHNACATNPPRGFAWEDPFTLKRIKISRTADNPLNLWFKTSGYYTFFKDFSKSA